MVLIIKAINAAPIPEAPVIVATTWVCAELRLFETDKNAFAIANKIETQDPIKILNNFIRQF